MVFLIGLGFILNLALSALFITSLADACINRNHDRASVVTAILLLALTLTGVYNLGQNLLDRF